MERIQQWIVSTVNECLCPDASQMVLNYYMPCISITSCPSDVDVDKGSYISKEDGHLYVSLDGRLGFRRLASPFWSLHIQPPASRFHPMTFCRLEDGFRCKSSIQVVEEPKWSNFRMDPKDRQVVIWTFPTLEILRLVLWIHPNVYSVQDYQMIPAEFTQEVVGWTDWNGSTTQGVVVLRCLRCFLIISMALSHGVVQQMTTTCPFESTQGMEVLNLSWKEHVLYLKTADQARIITIRF